MITRDANMLWRPGRVYMPAFTFAGLKYSGLGVGQASAATITSATTATNSFYINAIAGAGYTGLVTSSFNDAVNHLMEVPYDMDVTKNVYVRVWWTANDTSGTNAVTWAVTYCQMIRDTTILTTPFGALNSAIGSDVYPSTSAFVLAGSPLGRINANTINKNTEFIGWRIQMTTHNLAAQPILIGLEMTYTPRRLVYQDGMPIEAKQMTNILGDVSAN